MKSSTQKKKPALADIFKAQVPTGKVDLSSKNLSDSHVNQLCQIIKKYHSGVKHLDLSNN